MNIVNPLDWFFQECYWSVLDEGSTGTREYYGGALRQNKSDSPFFQPSLKVVKIRFMVADKQRQIAGNGYKGHVLRIECQDDVVRGWGHVVEMQSEEDR